MHWLRTEKKLKKAPKITNPKIWIISLHFSKRIDEQSFSTAAVRGFFIT